MIAPVIEVFGTERIITLTGSSGAQLSRKAWNSNKSGVAGANGQHGKHGFSSGELKIIALQVSNEELLLVNSTGGSGSNGQSGGNGFSSNHVSHPEDYSRRVHLEHELLDHLRGRYHLGPITGPKEKVIPIPVAGVYTQVDFEITKYIRAEARGDGKESNGGNGGNGGNASGSGAIDILVRGTPKKIRLSEKNGTVGLAGEGGSAGVWNCLFKEFVCDGKKGSKWVLFIPVDRFRDKYEFTCRTNGKGNCGRVAKSGRNGVAGRLVSKRYKFTPLKIHQLVMHFWRETSKTTGKAELYPMDLYQFWNFLHRSKQVKLSIKEATSFPFIFDPTVDMAKDDSNFVRIQSDLSSMYMTFKNFKKECSTCNVNELEIIETTFASRLRILQTFNKNKRTSYLQNAVDDMIKKIEHIESSDGKILPEFFTLSPDIDEEIKSANERIEEITGVVLSGINNEIEKDFEEISLAYQNLQSETELKSKLSATLRLKAQLEVFSTISKISSALHYFAEGMTKNEIPDNEKYFPDEFKVALDVLKFVIFRKLEVHRETTPQQIAAVKTLLEEDMNYGGVLKQKSDRTQLLEILEQKEGMEENFGNEIQNVLETVESDLDEKILGLKLSENNSNALEIERLIKLQKTLKDARYSISGEIYKFALQKLPENTSLYEIQESNKLFMQQLDWYGKTINENFNSFLFMMQAILVNFKKSDVEDFLPGAVKKFTRKLIYTIEKFTSDLPEVRNKFGGHFYELEKVLHNVIDAMDKFDEINYLIKIENFLSNCPEGNCGQDETIAMIASNEFVRLFAHYWSAYQQISFPLATEQISFFKNTLKELNKLKESSFKERIVVLKQAFKSMSKDLSNENNNFSFGQFNSKYAASKSFYTWPNQQFSSQIKKILNGEETIMAASVFSPGVKNAVKFNSVFLNFTSSANPKVTRDINDLLTHFRLEMRHPGESRYRCGNMIYSVGGDPIFFTANFARDENGQFISRSSAFASLKQSANSFSPYAVWKFRLVPNSDRDHRHLIKELSGFVGKVDLELVGSGFYLEEDADSCAKDQGQFYTYFGTK
ncbi:uncharacterized protein LOC132204163 [Neocloeon triangulifer]|uniref:uncharacterized protein LOC132204163 n=1 Tax=Neocloeon triangulifer TaxID=2078957 RepID=UPI00286F7A66|nr:uncharacterized protein LOC132204163 [Neocloeon triangulifer]